MDFLSVNLSPIILSFKLAFLSSFILFFICFFLAYFLARCDFFGKSVFESLFTLPLVLPPTVLGFYLLLAFSPNYAFGKFLKSFDISLLFNFYGLLIASIIYSLPFMLNSLKSGFLSLDDEMILRARLLKKSHFYIMIRLSLKAMLPSIILGFVLSFAHTLGEFGVVIMIGGSIANETKVASIAIFEAIESMDYLAAHTYALILLFFSFFVIFIINTYSKKFHTDK